MNVVLKMTVCKMNGYNFQNDSLQDADMNRYEQFARYRYEQV